MGQKLAAFNTNHAFVGYHDTQDSPPPSGRRVIEISDEQWQELMAEQSIGRVLTVSEGGMILVSDPPLPTVEEITASNAYVRDGLLDTATRAINPLQDAVDTQSATPAEESLLLKWKVYRRDVNRVDLTQVAPAWPEQP
ncbi:tail fiber assembly protein [Pseudomonas sp. SWRI74]|uniref:Tail fiber assembly protein n=1 Tax=Pseudomonas azerbaijanoccidentalis TaxID=2842347 RepID=A0ABS6QTH0_9PSED|nr:tail fiber assembly protein [Pseudomonas azerbaijanoccidentalis]MBV4522203.1 tail fiber assembly protein [Pseudomonas azerbaijanoccidentalis]